MFNGFVGWVRRLFTNPIFLFVLAAIILLFVTGRYLGTHPAGLSPAEVTSRSHSQSLSAIYHNPLNAPHSLAAFVFHKLGLGWATSLRLSSLIFGLAFAFCFYWLVKGWFGRWIGLMGTVIFLTTPIFLIMSRDGSAAVMYFGITALMSIYGQATKPQSSPWYLMLLLPVCALLIYTPGIFLWLVGALVICRKKFTALFEGADPPLIGAAVLLSILLLVPLGFAVFKDVNLLKQLGLVPSHFASVLGTLESIGWMVLALFIRTPHHDPYIIGRLPVLNIVADALVVFGIFAMWQAARLKLIFLFVAVIYAVIMAGLNDNIAVLSLAIPPLAILVCAGVRYLYIEWRGVFPRNPLAKSLAYSLMWVVVLVQLAFGFRYSVLAWPATTDTRANYVLK